MNNVNVVYTPWTNLKKTADMDVGQIGFHRQKDVSARCRHGRARPNPKPSLRSLPLGSALLQPCLSLALLPLFWELSRPRAPSAFVKPVKKQSC